MFQSEILLLFRNEKTRGKLRELLSENSDDSATFFHTKPLNLSIILTAIISVFIVERQWPSAHNSCFDYVVVKFRQKIAPKTAYHFSLCLSCIRDISCLSFRSLAWPQPPNARVSRFPRLLDMSERINAA